MLARRPERLKRPDSAQREKISRRPRRSGTTRKGQFIGLLRWIGRRAPNNKPALSPSAYAAPAIDNGDFVHDIAQRNSLGLRIEAAQTHGSKSFFNTATSSIAGHKPGTALAACRRSEPPEIPDRRPRSIS